MIKDFIANENFSSNHPGLNMREISNAVYWYRTCFCPNMKFILLLFVNLTVGSAFAQLKCREVKFSDDSSQKKCFHQNGSVSIVETWDKEHRSGSVRGYNAEGKELFFHNLRTYGGHASVQLEYFPNGQVYKIYFSDAPDGGIQYYNSTTLYDEKGNQTDFSETKYPEELEPFLIEEPLKKAPEQEIVDTLKQEVVECAPIYSTIYQIQNATDMQLRVNIKTLPNNVVSGTEKELVLEPFQTIDFDTVFMAGQFISAQIYQPEVLKPGPKLKRNRKVAVIEPDPLQSPQTRTYYWFVVRKGEAFKLFN